MQTPPRHIVIAPDSFKESLCASTVAAAIGRGLATVWSDAKILERPIADGGEGTVDAVLSAVDGERISVSAHDALMRPIIAHYGLIDGGTTAVIEVAAASGLALVSKHDRDPMRATSFGTGELIRDALDRKVERVIIGIGGSATNDGGTGIASALGIAFLNEKGDPVSPGGGSLHEIAMIDETNVHSALATTPILVACDVSIPLCGPSGSMLNYSAQKGASPTQTATLENGMVALAGLLDTRAGYAVSALPGAGAAGGIGAGLVTLCGGTLESGFELLAGLVQLEDCIAEADLVITGEGQIDVQTGHGKAPMGVATMAAGYDRPVVAFCGASTADARRVSTCFHEIVSIEDVARDRADAMLNADVHLEKLAESFARRWS